MNLLRNRPLAVAVTSGVGLTVTVLAWPFAQFAYDNPSLHLALETGEGLIAALLAFLHVQRFRTTRRIQHATLAWVFSLLAVANLALSAGPLIAERARTGGWFAWAVLALRLVASFGLAASAFVGVRARARSADAGSR